MNKFVGWLRKKDKSFIEQILEAIIVVVPIAFAIRTFGYGLYQVPSGSMETTMLVGERFIADKFTIWFSSPKRGDIIACNSPLFKYSDNKFVELMQRYVWVPGNLTPDNWTKRVIAIPGDEIKGVIEEGKPVVYLKKSGEAEFTKLDEPYVNKYPIVFVYHPNGSRDASYESYDPSCSYERQPFYRMTETEARRNALLAKRVGWSPIEYPGTPLILNGRNVDEYQVKLGENQYWVMGDNRLGSSDSRVWGVLDGKLIHGRIVFRIWSLNSYEGWFIVDLIKHPIDFWKRVRWNRCLELLK